MKIAVLLIIYNKCVDDSISIKKLIAIKSDIISVTIIDNSESDYGNVDSCLKFGFNYLSMNGNKGISRAYNAGIDSIIDKFAPDDVVVLLDDDTDISRDYFECLKKQIEVDKDVDIFAPIVYGQDGVIYSPSRANFLKNKLIKDVKEEIPSSEFFAIASCLAIRLRIFDAYRFNEALFVDQVDQFFCYEQRMKGRIFKKLDCAINQNFYQRGEHLSTQKGWSRLENRIKDICTQARLMGGFRNRLISFIKCAGLSLQIAQKCKSFVIVVKGLSLSVKETVNSSVIQE